MPAGSLTREQLLRAWIDAVDPDYARGVLSDPDSAAAIEQGCEQLALVSVSFDEAMQSLFAQKGSGQTFDPAPLPSRADVELRITRTKRLGDPLVLPAGRLVEEVAVDAGEDGPVEVLTGRRFALSDHVVLFPGVTEALHGAIAERPGRGYRFPIEGSLRALVAPGRGLENDGASVVASAVGPHVLVSASKPDAPVPQLVGQRIALVGGANTGTVWRIAGYVAPSPPEDAGRLLLARDVLLVTSAISGDLFPGEEVLVEATGAKMRLLGIDPASGRALVEMTNGSLAPLDVAVGQQSGASFTVDVIEADAAITSEVGTASWLVVDEVIENGLSITNDARPEGGTDDELLYLAREFGTSLAAGESEEGLRDRLADPDDTVTNGAVWRAANRALGPIGAEATYREPCTPEMPGLFADVDACDLDSFSVSPATPGFLGGEVVVQASTGARGIAITTAPLGVDGPLQLVGIAKPEGVFAQGDPIVGATTGQSASGLTFQGGPRLVDRFRLADSYADSRAFFLIGLRGTGAGDFGAFCDVGACDSEPALDFFDGFAATGAAIAQRVWQAVDDVRPQPGGFDIVKDS